MKIRPAELAAGLLQPGDILVKLGRGPGQNETGKVVSTGDRPNYIPGHSHLWEVIYETSAGDQKSLITAGPHIPVWVHMPVKEDNR